MIQIDPQHPKQKLVFYISDDIDDENDAVVMQDMVAALARSRQWVTGPPVFLNEWQEDAEAGSLRTLGGYLDIYSALPPWGETLPKNIDRAHLDEVRAITGALAEFSEKTGHEIAFELDGAQIGWIEKGVIGHSLNERAL